MYELGLRHTRNRLTIHIGERERLPFDVSTIRTIRFRRTERGLIEAREALRAALERGLREGFDPVAATRIWAEEGPAPPQPPVDEEGPGEERDTGGGGGDADRPRGPGPSGGVEELADDPGMLELLAESEEALPELNDVLTRMGEATQEMGRLAEEATAEMQKTDDAGGGARARLAIAIRFADSLKGPAAELGEASVSYESVLRRVDPGFSYIISRLEDEPELASEADEFVSSVVTMADAAAEAMESTEALGGSLSGVETAARPLRPVVRDIRMALLRIREASGLIAGWKRRLENLAT